MSTYKFHYRRNIPNGLKRVVHFMTAGKVLDFGPAATKQWLRFFGAHPKAVKLPSTVRIIEITTEDADLDKALFRWQTSPGKDTVVSVCLRNLFVIGAWSCPSSFNPSKVDKYNTTSEIPAEILAQWKQLTQEVDHAAA